MVLLIVMPAAGSGSRRGSSVVDLDVDWLHRLLRLRGWLLLYGLLLLDVRGLRWRRRLHDDDGAC